MKYTRFNDFLQLKEGADGPKKTSTGRKLEKGNEFVVDRHSNPELIPIINAFVKSGNIRIGDFIPGGYATGKPDGSTEEPKLKAKTLYLVGGAVRDHMMGKKPKDLDCATDATPSEIRMILLSQGFVEVEPQGGKVKDTKSNVEKIKPPKGVTPHPDLKFYSKGWDKAGNEFVFGILSKGVEIELATFRSDSKSGDGRTPDKMSYSDLAGDAARRDFTINAMYIKLTNSDGPNHAIEDPHGGLTHMQGGKGKTDVLFVGKASERLDEDQLRAFRFIRFYCKYGRGSGDKIPKVYKDQIKALAEAGFPAVSKERVREEFLKGLEDDEVDPKKYVRLYKELGVLDTVFKGMVFKLDTPTDLSNEKDRILAVAWILRKNPDDQVAKMLKESGWTNEEVKKVTYLLRFLKFHPHIGAEELVRFHTANPWPGEFANDGGRLDKWAKMTGMPGKHAEALRQYTRDPMTRVYDDKGSLNPEPDRGMTGNQ